MVLEALAEHKESPAILEFNPWNWAAQEKVSEAFYREVQVSLGKKDVADQAQQAAAKWRRYKELLEIGGVFVEATEWLVGTTLRDSLFLALAIAGAVLGSTARSKSLWVITAALFSLAALVRFGNKVAGLIADRKAAAIRKQTLQDAKIELAVSLRELQRPLLVVIDDIDRLSANEIREVVQLVKANASLPNLIYLLLFERKVVEEALNEVTNGRGREFLEKIVQVPFDLPTIEKRKLEGILQSKIQALIAEMKVPFDEQRWSELIADGLTAPFETLRDVYRFLSTLSFHIDVFRKPEAFEVSVVDLMALEVLRMFKPDIYRAIRDNRSVLTGENLSHPLRAVRPDAKAIFDEILKLEEAQTQRDRIRKIILDLFPPLRAAVEEVNWDSEQRRAWSKDLRVCLPDYFGRYFLFRSPEDDISEAKFLEILASSRDKHALLASFNDLSAVNLLPILIERLRSRVEEISKDSTGILIATLFDSEKNLMLNLGATKTTDPGSSFLFAMFLIHQLLVRVEDKAARFNFTVQALDFSERLFLASMVLFTGTEHSDQLLFLPPDLLSLRDIWINKVKAAARSGTLTDNIELARILLFWHAHNTLECTSWIEMTIKERSGLYSLLAAFTQRNSNISGDKISFFNTFNINDLKTVVPLTKVESQLNMAHFEPVTEQEKMFFELAKEAIRKEPKRLNLP